MLKVGCCKARARFSQLLTRVAAGESIIITRRGEEVAYLVPPPQKSFSRERFERARAQWEKARKNVKLKGLKIRDLINEGRR